MKSARDTATENARSRELKPTGIEFPTEDRLQTAVQTFGMLGDPTRLRILLTLLQGEQTVNRLAELVGMPQPTVSQHLAKLRMARLVRQRRDGSHIFYEVDHKQVRPLVKQALGQDDGSAQNMTRRTGTRKPDRRALGGSLGSGLSGWSLNHGHSLPVASSAGLAINAPAVVGSLTVGILLMAPVSRLAGALVNWLDQRSVPSAVAMLAFAALAVAAILLDISRYDPSGPALAWSPGVSVVSLGAANILRRVSQARVRQRFAAVAGFRQESA